jgi:hypothetical protein
MTEAEVRQIMALRQERGWGAKQIGEHLGLGRERWDTVWEIIHGRVWNSVTGLPRYQPDSRHVKMTEAEVRRIMALRTEHGWSAPRIAEHLGLDRRRWAAVHAVIYGLCWNHVTGLTPFHAQGRHVKMTEAEVRQIMEVRRAHGWGPARIADHLGLDRRRRSAIGAVINGLRWNDVTGLPPHRPRRDKPKAGSAPEPEAFALKAPRRRVGP